MGVFTEKTEIGGLSTAAVSWGFRDSPRWEVMPQIRWTPGSICRAKKCCAPAVHFSEIKLIFKKIVMGSTWKGENPRNSKLLLVTTSQMCSSNADINIITKKKLSHWFLLAFSAVLWAAVGSAERQPIGVAPTAGEGFQPGTQERGETAEKRWYFVTNTAKIPVFKHLKPSP